MLQKIKKWFNTKIKETVVNANSKEQEPQHFWNTEDAILTSKMYNVTIKYDQFKSSMDDIDSILNKIDNNDNNLNTLEQLQLCKTLLNKIRKLFDEFEGSMLLDTNYSLKEISTKSNINFKYVCNVRKYLIIQYDSFNNQFNMLEERLNKLENTTYTSSFTYTHNNKDNTSTLGLVV